MVWVCQNKARSKGTHFRNCKKNSDSDTVTFLAEKAEGICPRLQEGVLYSREPAQHGQRSSRKAAPHIQGGGRASVTR
jgi:hypothetical protein